MRPQLAHSWSNSDDIANRPYRFRELHRNTSQCLRIGFASIPDTYNVRFRTLDANLRHNSLALSSGLSLLRRPSAIRCDEAQQSARRPFLLSLCLRVWPDRSTDSHAPVEGRQIATEIRNGFPQIALTLEPAETSPLSRVCHWCLHLPPPVYTLHGAEAFGHSMRVCGHDRHPL
jgi:hypothetical protein